MFDTAGGRYPLTRMSSEELLGRLTDYQRKREAEEAGADFDAWPPFETAAAKEHHRLEREWWEDLLGTTQKLARALRPLGVRPKHMRFRDGVKRGYERDSFRRAMDRLDHSPKHRAAMAVGGWANINAPMPCTPDHYQARRESWEEWKRERNEDPRWAEIFGDDYIATEADINDEIEWLQSRGYFALMARHVEALAREYLGDDDPDASDPELLDQLEAWEESYLESA